MHARSLRTLVAVLSALALIGTLTVMPVAGQLTEPDCVVTEDGTVTEDVADAITLTFDSDFVCADAADSGTWSIVVAVTNDSEAEVSIDDLELSHVTPSDPDGNELTTTSDLPLEIGAGESGEFGAGGTFALAGHDAGALVNLHLRATGTAASGDEVQPFVLGINVHLLGPGVEPDGSEDGEEGEGRPDWVPGPPPWVVEMMRSLFGDDFPPGFWMVVNRNAQDAPDSEGGEEGSSEAEEGSSEEEEGQGPPSWVPGPPPWAGGNDDEEESTDDGPPSWVPGPPARGGGDGEGAGGPPGGPPGRP
jgi:hypothetical protein